MNAPSMRDFHWSLRGIDPMHQALPGNLWCVRDAFCALMGWVEGSDEWNAFIEAPAPEDMDRLIEHLGLVWFDLGAAPVGARNEAAGDHPGISCYNLRRLALSHLVYEPNLRHLRGLPVQYRLIDPDPELFGVIADLRQPPARVPPSEPA